MKRSKGKAVTCFLIGGVLWGVFVAMTAPDLPGIKLVVGLASSLGAIILISVGIHQFGSESVSEGISENKRDS